MRALVVFVACLALASAARDFRDVRFQDQSAREKLKQLWNSITEDTQPYGWYSKLSLLKLFLEAMKPTFDTYSDVMPKDRCKYIHSVGSVVQAEFIADQGHNYTGVFKGASNALIRISLAKQPDPKSAPEGNFAPGMGIKILRDNIPSANLVAMYGVDGQDSWNIFKNDWSHHIANPCSFALKLLAKKFAEATPFIGRMGLKTWAQYDEKGNQVPDNKIVIPYKLIFSPTTEVKNLFPDTYKDDFNKQLATIPSETPLFDVFAVPQPRANAVKIGTFRTTSQFTTSKFGDKDLFFQHNYVEDDIAIHPEWKEAYEIDPPVYSQLMKQYHKH